MLRPLAIAALVAVSTPAAADTGDLRLELAGDRLDDGRAHLWRNLVWGSVSAAGGAALALTSDRAKHPTRWAFGVQTAIWGGIDIAIAGVGLYLLAGPPDDRDLAETIDKERLFHDALLLNMGLDVGYVAVGAAMLVAARKDFANAAEWRGHGAAIVIQGSALLAFEIVAWRQARRRLGRLIDLQLSVGDRSVGVAGRF